MRPGQIDIGTVHNSASTGAEEPESTILRNLIPWFVFLAVSVVVAVCYLWNLRVVGERFDWGYDLGGYYNHLGRALTQGQLHLPITPDPELLELSDPWEVGIGEEYKIHDLVFFNDRYYLYHGVGPAIMLFTPWRLFTGHDLPERFALFLLCFGGFCFSSAALLTLLGLAKVRLSPLLLALMLLALGLCQEVPFLLNRVHVYEIAIGGAYFCISGAIFFLTKAFQSPKITWWLWPSGLMFGLAVSCRPHVGVAGIVITLVGLTIYLVRSRGFTTALHSRELISFVIPLALVGIIIALYNYQRFGNPMEFGHRFVLAHAPTHNQLDIGLRNIIPGLYYLLLSPPHFSAVFPWAEMVARPPFNSMDLPPGYFIEPTIGALWIAPFLIGAVFIPRARQISARSFEVRKILWTVFLSAIAILLFLMSTHLATQRYEVDFLPLLVLVAFFNLAVCISHTTGLIRSAVVVFLVIAVIYSIVMNFALGVAGPYDDVLRYRPAGYVRLARLFSPITEFRPMIDPEIHIEFDANFRSQPSGSREPLITIGRLHHRCFLYVEHISGGALRLVSRTDHSEATFELGELNDKPLRFRSVYSPGALTVAVNGQTVLQHSLETIVTAPSQVTIGENRTDSDFTARKFMGRLQLLQKVVRAQR